MECPTERMHLQQHGVSQIAWLMHMYDGGDGGESAVANTEVVVNPGVTAFRLLPSVSRLRQVQVVLMNFIFHT